MKKIILLFVLGMILTGNAFAQSKFPNAVIGIIDLAKIQKEAKIYKGLLKEREKFIEAQKPKISEKENELKEEENKILKEKGKISEEDLDKKILAFRKKVFEVQSEVEKDNLEFNKAISATSMEVSQNALHPIITDIALKNGITLVLSSAQVIFFADGIDITEEAIKMLDSKHPSIKMKKPAPAKKAPEKKKK